MGIMFGGNNLVIEYNHIRHVNLETEDTGAVYTGGRDWTRLARHGRSATTTSTTSWATAGATASGSRRTSPGASTSTTTPAAWT